MPEEENPVKSVLLPHFLIRTHFYSAVREYSKALQNLYMRFVTYKVGQGRGREVKTK